MEIVAWAMHKYIMHGFFWTLHEDHHSHSKKHSFLELNDSFFLFFSVIAIMLFGTWIFYGSLYFMASGLGVTVYGIVYLVIHDLFIHQRVKIWRNTKSPYLLALRRAHKVHHKHINKEGGECFGMLWVPKKYYREVFKK